MLKIQVSIQILYINSSFFHQHFFITTKCGEVFLYFSSRPCVFDGLCKKAKLIAFSWLKTFSRS